MKRQLNKEEKALVTKGLLSREESLNWLKYQIEYHDLMIERGIEVNYRKTLRDFRDKKKEFEGELAICEDTIKILRKQMREGVEIIEPKEEEDTSDKGGKK